MVIKVDSSVAVVFDLDDTLYNEVDFLKSAFKSIAQNIDEQNYQILYAKMFSLHRNKKDVFKMLADEFEVKKEQLLKLYRAHKPNIEPFDGAIQALKKIKELQGLTGIVTDGRKLTQMNKIEALGVGKYIDHIVISEEIGTEKPNPNNFTSLMNVIKAERYYYIADNLSKDFVAPRQLGWTTIALIDNGLNIHSDGYRFMKKYFMPHEFITSLEEIEITAQS